MVTKRQLLNLIDHDFLDILILNFDNKPRYHSFDSKESLIKFCCKKFSKKQIEEIFDAFKLGLPPNEVAKNMRELNGHELGLKYVELIKAKSYSFEVKLGGKRCDLVLLDDDLNLNAIEIKANNDNISRVLEQCEEYSKWADFVYTLAEIKNSKLLNKILPKNFGLILYDKHSNKFSVRKAKKIKEPNVGIILQNLNKEKLKILARNYKIKTSGTKCELLSRLKNLLENENFIIDVKKILLK